MLTNLKIQTQNTKTNNFFNTRKRFLPSNMNRIMKLCLSLNLMSHNALCTPQNYLNLSHKILYIKRGETFSLSTDYCFK